MRETLESFWHCGGRRPPGLRRGGAPGKPPYARSGAKPAEDT